MEPEERSGATIVLVVDDDPVMRLLVSRVLGEGNRVVAVASAEEADDWLGRDEPLDVLVSDVVLPGRDGVWLARRARGRRAGLGVVLLTGSGDVEAPPGVRVMGKPFEPGALRDAVRSASEGP